MNKRSPSRRLRARIAILSSSVAVALALFSCASVEPKEPVVNYSDERSVSHEVEQTRKVLEKDPLEALARAWVLKANASGASSVDDLYRDAGSKAASEFGLAVESGRWADALVLYRSLSNLSLAPTGWDEAKLAARQVESWRAEGNRTLAELDSVPRSTPEDEAPSPGTAARMIKGTLTVWVDRGIRIEKGVGYADRVIGSGFFIDPRGYFITNYHVIESEVNPKYEGYSRLYVKLPANPDVRIPAKVIGWDPVLDLALVKTEIEPPAVFSLGTSRDLSVGNRIYAIGSPAGLEQTITSGIVSAQKRRLLSLGDVLQIDAPINHGNSGGPIVDEAGRVQAVVFAGIEPYEGLNFAIPVEYLRVVLPLLYAGGKVSHPWMGAYGKTAGTIASGTGVGVTVVYVAPGSPLSLARVPEGTVVTAINGAKVAPLEDLQSLVIRERPRTIVKVTGTPPGETIPRDWLVSLAPRPELPGATILDRDLESRAFLPLFGLGLERVGSSRKYTVRSLVRGEIADESGFSEQDVVEIREVKRNKEGDAVFVQLFTKRRKNGYLESFIGVAASLDSPSYF